MVRKFQPFILQKQPPRQVNLWCLLLKFSYEHNGDEYFFLLVGCSSLSWVGVMKMEMEIKNGWGGDGDDGCYGGIWMVVINCRCDMERRMIC